MVFDSSAVLAYLNEEPGRDVVQDALLNGIVSTVNLSEIWARLISNSWPAEAIREALNEMALDFVDFDTGLAEATGELVVRTRRLGLSLGDRACIALARQRGLAVLTADRAWRDLQLGIEVQLIR